MSSSAGPDVRALFGSGPALSDVLLRQRLGELDRANGPAVQALRADRSSGPPAVSLHIKI